MQLSVNKEEDVIPAMVQVEYLSRTDGKMKQMCAEECLRDYNSSDLNMLEETCLAQCHRKLSIFYNSFYAQQAVILQQIAMKKAQWVISSGRQI